VARRLTRRRFLGSAAASLSLCGAPALAKERKRPNIVVILADDMGFSDLGCYGSEIATPHLDGLAREGLRFTQFYNAARCCPSRAALLTGLYPHQASVGHMSQDWRKPGYLGHLNDRCVTIGEVLRAAGYHTLTVGKWHVGERPRYWPLKRGFDRFYGTPEGGGHYFGLMKGRTLVLDDQAIHYPDGAYISDLFNDRAVEFIDRYGRGDKPFFLYLAHIAPHYPLHALPEDIARYRGKYRVGWDRLRVERHKRLLEMGIVEGKWPLSPRDRRARAWADVRNKEAWDLKMAIYAAQIDSMDRGIGRVLAKLREVGAEQNTLVVFLSDNGACVANLNRTPGIPPGTADSYYSYGPGWANLSNTPFRLFKGWDHEGGTATPFIARWPAVICQRGALTHQVAHITDIMATCLDMAGADYPESFGGKPIVPLAGKSLLPIFRGGTREGHDALFWEHQGNRAARMGRWKLAAEHGGRWELYDMEADRTELRDLAGRQPDRAAELLARYQAWARRCNVLPWPVKKKRRRRPGITRDRRP